MITNCICLKISTNAQYLGVIKKFFRIFYIYIYILFSLNLKDILYDYRKRSKIYFLCLSQQNILNGKYCQWLSKRKYIRIRKWWFLKSIKTNCHVWIRVLALNQLRSYRHFLGFCAGPVIAFRKVWMAMALADFRGCCLRRI